MFHKDGMKSHQGGEYSILCSSLKSQAWPQVFWLFFFDLLNEVLYGSWPLPPLYGQRYTWRGFVHTQSASFFWVSNWSEYEGPATMQVFMRIKMRLNKYSLPVKVEAQSSMMINNWSQLKPFWNKWNMILGLYTKAFQPDLEFGIGPRPLPFWDLEDMAIPVKLSWA